MDPEIVPKRASTAGITSVQLAFGLSDRSGHPGLGSQTGLGWGRKRDPDGSWGAEGRWYRGDNRWIQRRENLFCTWFIMIYHSFAWPVSGCHSDELSSINYAGTDCVTVISNYTHYAVEKKLHISAPPLMIPISPVCVHPVSTVFFFPSFTLMHCK